MPDDQVTIDPQFQPPAPGGGQGRWLRLAGVGAVVVAAFILGWLLRSPSPAEPEQTDLVASTSTTALTRETTSTEPPEVVGLGEAVPGFADMITMALWSEAGIDLMRWWPSQSAPKMIMSLRHDEPPGFAGLDASGAWYALHDGQTGVLSVRPVAGYTDDSPWGWQSQTFREAFGLRVAASAWHDSEPGRLAWVTCSRAPGGPVTLYTLDLTDRAAEPVPLPLAEGACSENTWMHLGGWGEWGFELARWEHESEDGGEEVVLLDVDGTELATLSDDVGFSPGPGGVIWTEETSGLGATSYLGTVDGQTREPVPGLADDEWADNALWSPDGLHLALSPRKAFTETPMIRIVDVTTSTIVGEITESGREVWPMTWSTDGRFLFYLRESDDQEREPPVDWVLFDTATGVATELSVPVGEFDEIRTSEPAQIAEQFTPVDWGIAPDAAGPGAHMVSMIVDVRPLLPGQVEDVSGTLVWNETVVDPCNIEIRDAGAGFLHIGDIFGTDEGCGANPTAMQDAFDKFGLPETACLALRVDGVDHEYCAPLS